MEFFLGQIILFGGNFAIRGFALAQGQLLSISSYSAVFSLYGTTYGGDGRTTFGLPDLRGRVPIGEGNGPGLTHRGLGARGGSETNVLTVNQMPPHSHNIPVNVTAGEEDEANPGVGVLANSGADNFTSSTANGSYGGGGTTSSGAGQAFNNMQPWLAINYEVCLQGVFPSRS